MVTCVSSSPGLASPFDQPTLTVVPVVYGSVAMATAPSIAVRKRTKREVCDNFICNLRERGDVAVDAPGFAESVYRHFETLPTRYALDINIDGLDVLNHKRLLEEARGDPSAVSFAVRPVEVVVPKCRDSLDGPCSPSRGIEVRRSLSKRNSLPKPAFGSSPNLQALALEATEKTDVLDDPALPEYERVTFYEITIASMDQPKLLSRLSDAMGDLGLNIREAHAFNTTDGFSLDVFVVDGWAQDASESSLSERLGQRLMCMPAPPNGLVAKKALDSPCLKVPEEPQFEIFPVRPGSPAVDDWEIDITQLHIETKIASGSFSNLYRGFYCGQEVAVKILKDIQDDSTQYQEFIQEVSIMRKVRHKNVVQFIGACTRKPNLCIVFEYMSGGSLYDYMRREGPLKYSLVLKYAVGVVRGMDYLHQRKIIHRDLKTANLLLDENHTVKIADFGVARILAESGGHMTAETGTYRWMAPEVIEHKPYDERADVFSFGIVLWELLTCKVPYQDMTPLQAAVGVVQKGLRPGIPSNCPPDLAEIMQQCWDGNPAARPTFRALTAKLQPLLDAAREDESRKPKAGLLSKLRGKGT